MKPKQIYFYRLRAIGDDGEWDWTDELPLYTGEGQGKLKITPAKLSFGPVRVGRSKIRKIRPRNTGQVALACTVGDEIQDSFFQVDKLTEPRTRLSTIRHSAGFHRPDLGHYWLTTSGVASAKSPWQRGLPAFAAAQPKRRIWKLWLTFMLTGRPRLRTIPAPRLGLPG